MDIVSCLPCLLASDNAMRHEAERRFSASLQAAPQQSLAALLSAVRNDNGICDPLATPSCNVLTLRAFAAVMLRRLIRPSGEVLKELDSAALCGLRAEILRTFCALKEPQILRQVSHLLVRVAEDAEWPELLDTTLPLLESGSEAQRSAVLLLVKELSRMSRASFAQWEQRVVEALGAVICKKEAGAKLRLEGVQAAVRVMIMVLDEQPSADLAKFLEPILSALSDAVAANVEDLFRETLVDLADLADSYPMLFKHLIDAYVGAMLACAAAANESLAHLDYSTRIAALEFVVVLCANAPAMMRRSAALQTGELVHVCVSLIASVEEDMSDWCMEVYDPEAHSLEIEDDREEIALSAEEALERVILSVGVRTTMPPLMTFVEQLLADGDWRKRRAGFLALARAADANPKTLHSHLDIVCHALLQGLQDDSPRVVYAASQTVGRVCEVYPGKIQARDGTSMLEKLYRIFSASASMPPQVIGHAGAALVSFCRAECPGELLVPVLSQLLESIASALQNASPAVATALLQAVAAMATVCETDFTPYYAAFMNGIKGILSGTRTAMAEQKAVDPNAEVAARKLFGSAMEVAGLIGDAVGVEVFAADAHCLMQLLLPLLAAHGSNSADQHSLFEHVLPGAGFIARALGPEFSKYLEYVLPPLDVALKAEPQFSYSAVDEDMGEGSDAEDGTDENGLTSATLNIPGHGKCRITLNTDVISEKQSACRIVYELAAGLGETFSSARINGSDPIGVWALQCLLPNCCFKFNEDVRCAASLSVGEVFGACCKSLKRDQMSVEVVQTLLNETVASLCKAMTGDTSNEAVTCAAEAMHTVLLSAYESGGRDEQEELREPRVRLNEAGATTALNALLHVAQGSITRQLEAENRHRGNETHDEEDDGALYSLLEEEDDLLQHCTDAIGYLIKTFKGAFFPIFQTKIEPIYAPLLRVGDAPSTMLPALRCCATCVFDDAVEHLGAPAVEKYATSLLSAVLKEASCDDEDGLQHWGLRQAAVYGLGQVCRHAPALVDNIASAQVAPLLQNVLEANRDDQDGADEDLKENAESAIKDLLEFVLVPKCKKYEEAANKTMVEKVSQWVFTLNKALASDLENAVVGFTPAQLEVMRCA